MSIILLKALLTTGFIGLFVGSAFLIPALFMRKTPIKSHRPFGKKKRFKRILKENGVHELDKLLDLILSVPPDKWTSDGDYLEADLCESNNGKLRLIYKYGKWLEVLYEGRIFVDIRFSDGEPKQATLFSHIFEEFDNCDDAKWSMLYQHLSSLNRQKQAVAEETARLSLEREQNKRERHLLKMKNVLQTLLETGMRVNTKSTLPFRLDVTAFKTANMATATLYFGEEAFVAAEWKDNKLTSRWIRKGRDFETTFSTLALEIDEYLNKELPQQISIRTENEKENKMLSLQPFHEVDLKIRSLLSDVEWLEDGERYLLEVAYPHDLKRLYLSAQDAGGTSAVSAHTDEALDMVHMRLDEIRTNIQKRKEKQVVEVKNILLVREP